MTLQLPTADVSPAGIAALNAAPNIKHGHVHCYFIYDVANTIDLAQLLISCQAGFGENTVRHRESSIASCIQFAVPPMSMSLPSTDVGGMPTKVRLKAYDYGILSIRLSFDYKGSWLNFSEFTRNLRQSAELTQRADAILTELLRRASVSLDKPHDTFLEDYFILEVESFEQPITSTQLLGDHKDALALLMVSEKGQLSEMEREESLRVRFSYFETDLTVIQWDTAFVFDCNEGSEAVENILEFANTQLVELRSYDDRLDSDLDEIYRWNLGRSKTHWLWGRRTIARRAERLRRLLVDIQELADRNSNAFKVVGDAFYARLYRGAAARLCLADWQKQIERKLNGVSGIYIRATEDAQHARSDFLEVVIIVLIVVEMLLFILRVQT